MIKEIAVKLLPLVNDKKSIDLLNSYMEHRVEELHRLLEQQDKSCPRSAESQHLTN